MGHFPTKLLPAGPGFARGVMLAAGTDSHIMMIKQSNTDNNLSKMREKIPQNLIRYCVNRVRTGPGNLGKPWKIFEALEIPGNPWKSPGIFS